MAGREHEAKKVVADVVVDGGVQVGNGRVLLRVELVSELLVLALEQLASPKQIDRAMLRRGHEPCTRIVRDPCRRPLLERNEKRILREILRLSNIADDACEPGDHFR